MKQAQCFLQAERRFDDEDEMQTSVVGGIISAAIVLSFCGRMTNGAFAAEWKSEAHNFSVYLPDGWNQVEVPKDQVHIAARKADDSWSVVMMTSPSGGATEMTPRFVAGIKRGYEAKGGSVASERLFTVNGRPTCELELLSTADGTEIKTWLRTTIVNKKVYQLMAIGRADDPLDPEARKSLDSFQVLRATTAAPPASTVMLSSSREGANDSPDRASYVIGTLVFGFVIVGGFAGVIALLTRTIIRARNRPPQPPLLR